MKSKPHKPPKDYQVKESDILPYDSLISNRTGNSDPNMYFREGKESRQNINFNVNPQDQFNAPPWLSDNVKTMGDERNELFKEHGLQDHPDEVSRNGLSRDDKHSEYGGANIFARIHERKENDQIWGKKKHLKRRMLLAHGTGRFN